MLNLEQQHEELIHKRHKLKDELDVAEFEYKRWERDAASAVINGRDVPEKPNSPEVLRLAIEQLEAELEENRLLQKEEKRRHRIQTIDELKAKFDEAMDEYLDQADKLIQIHTKVSAIHQAITGGGLRPSMNVGIWNRLVIPNKSEIMYQAVGLSANNKRAEAFNELINTIGTDYRKAS